MILVRWLVVWVGVWWVGVAVARPVRAVGERPNVVILLADDLGIQDLGCFGRREHRTPHLDRLAAEGARFTQAYAAASVCSPSRAALLTGLSPARLRITTFLNGRSDRASHRLLSASIERGLPAGATTLAEALRARGYRTAAVGKWHLGGAGSLPTDRGFAEYTPGQSDPGPESPLGGKGELGQADAAVDFIRRSKGQPFLLYVAFDTPHIPLAAPAGAVTAKAAGSPTVFHPAYAAMVESLDAACGRILKALDETGVTGDTLVAFASDNGGLHVPELSESPPTHNSPYWAGKGHLYEGGIRTPLLVRYPGRITAGRTIPEPVVLGDLMPTICALAGASGPTAADFQDLSPLLFEGKVLSARPLFWHQPHYMNQGGRPAGAVREGDWKLLEHYEDGRLELYRLSDDPGETRDLAAAEPDRVAALRGRLEAWRRSVGTEPLRPNPNFDRAAWDRCHGEVDVSRLPLATTSEAIRPPLAAWRRAMDDPSRGGVHSLVFLEARDAKVSGEKLLYEKPPHKDTLGYWVNPADIASWTFAAPRAGRYRVTVLQGCGRGQGGSVVALECGDSRLEFTVEETGHFQRFVPREVGLLTLAAGMNTLQVRPVRKARAAVMDLRRVMLERMD